MPVNDRYRPAPRALELDEGFYDLVDPASFPKHLLRFRNQRHAARIGLEGLSDDEWIRHFARFEPLPDNIPKPMALRYHGHQFMAYNPALGDGRGFLFAQLVDDHGRLLDLGTKGSGQTPWSRGGDGRLTLKGGVREVLATEMLEALGVNTSKSFSLVETGERLQRYDEPSPTRSSVLVRLSHSHIRFGSFQRHAHRRDLERLKRLLDHSVEVHFPWLAGAVDLPAAFLREVCHRTARLCASWMAAGFVHGVLNTDNMNINGESFDYGPYRFLPVYDQTFVAAYFDHSGLYAFGRQPHAVLWNLSQLAAALRPIAPDSAFDPVIEAFSGIFERAWQEKALARLGLRSIHPVADEAMLDAVYGFLQFSRMPIDQFFFDWYGGVASEERALAGPAAAHYRGDLFRDARRLLENYLPARPERLELPFFRRASPPTLVIDEIEAIWDAIDQRDDWAPFEQRIEEIRALGDALDMMDPPFTGPLAPG